MLTKSIMLSKKKNLPIKKMKIKRRIKDYNKLLSE